MIVVFMTCRCQQTRAVWGKYLDMLFRLCSAFHTIW